MLFFNSQVQDNQSPIGPISPANSEGDSPSSETTSRSSREQSSPRRKADIISMSPMPAPGVRTISLHKLWHLHTLSQKTAHRTLIVRKLKGLEDIIPYTSVHWEMLEKGGYSPTTAEVTNDCWPSKGWRFATPEEKIPGENVTSDPIHKNFTHLRDIYFDVDPEYKGRFTVPTLYDFKQNKIVSNEVWPQAFWRGIEKSWYFLLLVQRNHPHVLYRVRWHDSQHV